MSKLKALSATIVLSALCAGSATAATVSNVSGVVYEGGVAPSANAPAADIKLGDFNSNVSDPTLEIVGNTSIYGGVAHRTSTQYFDGWTMDFGTKGYDATFNWQKTSANFDGRITVGGTEFLLGDGGTISLGELSGVVTFVLDPLFGNFGPNPDEVATWDLQVSQVPLPAGVVLMLSGLAGFGLLRRKA